MSVFEVESNNLAQFFNEAIYRNNYGVHDLLVREDQLITVLTQVKEKFDYFFLLDITCVDNPENGTNRFTLVYHLLNLEKHFRLRVKSQLTSSEGVKSVSSLWKNANWYEREMADLFGISFSTKRDGLILDANNQLAPLRKDEQISGTNTTPDIYQHYFKPDSEVLPAESELTSSYEVIEPLHPATNMAVRVHLSLEGERVKQGFTEVGFSHHGLEKRMEQYSYGMIPYILQSYGQSSGQFMSTLWSMSCEQALGIEIPDRAKAIRMVILELVRIHHHILCLEKVFSFHHFCDDLEILACAKRVEALFFRFTSSKDNRINKPISIIGGLTSELPADWSVECMSCLEVLDGVFSSLRDRLVRSSFFMNEVKVCPFTAMEALSWGLSGPGLRACGVNYDLRKSNPFYFYKDVDFEVPLGINGDCYDRFLVLLSEIVQSTRVISQVIDHLPGGSILAYEAKEFDFKNVTLPVGDYYYSIESPKGEFGFYQVSSGEDKPYRVKLRTPSFCDAQSIEAAIEGNRFDEALTYINSLCLSPLEVDK